MKKIFPLLLILSLALNAWQLTRHSKSTGGESETQKSILLGNSTGNVFSESPRLQTRGAARKDSTPSSPPGSLSDVLAIADPLQRYEALLAFIKNLNADEIEGYLDELRPAKGKMDAEANLLRRLLLAKWTQEDPDAALASLSSASGKQAYADADAVLGTLAAMDPARAAAWLADPENSLLRQPWMGAMLSRAVAEQWAQQDHAGS